MSEMILLEMGVEFAMSPEVAEKLIQRSCVIMYKNAMAGHIPYEIL